MTTPETQLERQPLLSRPNVDSTEVYPIIHMIRADVMQYIDTPLSYEALAGPDLIYTLVRPLEEKYFALQRAGNLSIVFCFLINRVYFIRDDNLTTSTLSHSRAAFCEILAQRALREHGNDLMELALALTTSWHVYSGADPEIIARARDEREDLDETVGNAIEMAIISQAKRLIKSNAFQKVIDGIWGGKIVYQADSNHSIISDTYKRNPIHFYDPHKAPLLDHYRLKVPAIRSVLEYSNFLILFILFVVALEFNERNQINIAEGAFMIYALGFALEKIAAMQEHGIKVYFKGTWNGFDLAFVTLYLTYAIMRLTGVYGNNYWARDTGVDCLALIAVLMFPRLAFVTLRNNLMVLSLRAMIVQFVVLMFIAAFCFGGFLYALWTLSRNSAGYSAGQIAWWMLDLWFGLDASGFDNATKFHPLFGPLMMITYACLSNTLLLTVLVSILSHTFSTISDDAAAEAMFRRAVSTIEGVKADSLFSYQPPVNLVAVCIMLPASYVLSPRWFHKVNVFMIRLTSFPVLLLIAWYERQAKRTGSITFYETVSAAAEKVLDTLPRQLKRMSFFEGLVGSGPDIDAVFEIEDDPDDSAVDMREGDPLTPLGSIRQRRPSHASHRPRPSVSSGDSSRKPPRPSVTTAVRQRVNSIIRNDLASPLAQIFQPLVVDEPAEEGEEDNNGNSNGNGHSSTVVSYGPASRRRLTSIRSRTIAELPGGSAAIMRRFPASRPGPTTGQSLSDSPDERPGPASPGETADQVQEEGPSSMLVRRLEKMEKRQKRIEDMLIQLTRAAERP